MNPHWHLTHPCFPFSLGRRLEDPQHGPTHFPRVYIYGVHLKRMGKRYYATTVNLFLRRARFNLVHHPPRSSPFPTLSPSTATRRAILPSKRILDSDAEVRRLASPRLFSSLLLHLSSNSCSIRFRMFSRRGGDIWGRRGGGGVGGQRPLKHGMKGMAARLSVALIVLVICTLSLFSTIGVTRPSNRVEVSLISGSWISGD